jgi:two-component system response regulator
MESLMNVTAPIANSENRVRFFMAEDNPGDVMLMREAVDFSGIEADVEVAIDGELALERLLNPDLIIPDLIILNFNFPKLQGHQVLTEIKHTTRLLGVPVVMLTTSDAQRDRLLCQTADAYFVKSGDWSELLRIVRHFRGLVKLKSTIAPASNSDLAADPFWKQGNIGPQGTGGHPIADLGLPKASEMSSADKPLN